MSRRPFCEAESALGLLEDAADDNDRKLRGIAIVMKGLLAATKGDTIGKSDAENLLFDMAEQRLTMLPNWSVHVLLQYVATIEPAEALALIEHAGASDPLQPIVVALRRELGQDTHRCLGNLMKYRKTCKSPSCI